MTGASVETRTADDKEDAVARVVSRSEEAVVIHEANGCAAAGSVRGNGTAGPRAIDRRGFGA